MQKRAVSLSSTLSEALNHCYSDTEQEDNTMIPVFAKKQELHFKSTDKGTGKILKSVSWIWQGRSFVGLGKGNKGLDDGYNPQSSPSTLFQRNLWILCNWEVSGLWVTLSTMKPLIAPLASMSLVHEAPF